MKLLLKSDGSIFHVLKEFKLPPKLPYNKLVSVLFVVQRKVGNAHRGLREK